MSTSLAIAKSLYKEKKSLNVVRPLLVRYRLLALLPEIARHLIRLHKESVHKKTIRIHTPYQINEASLQKIKSLVGGEKEDHTVIIEPELLAGFRAVYDDRMYDGSAKRMLDTFIK
jgi:F0F1-type ATP synthase delta subunit